MHDNETIQSLSTEIAQGLRDIAQRSRDRVAVIIARDQLQTQHREERWAALMAEVEEISKRYK